MIQVKEKTSTGRAYFELMLGRLSDSLQMDKAKFRNIYKISLKEAGIIKESTTELSNDALIRLGKEIQDFLD